LLRSEEARGQGGVQMGLRREKKRVEVGRRRRIPRSPVGRQNAVERVVNQDETAILRAYYPRISSQKATDPIDWHTYSIFIRFSSDFH
jgi:hypothetical protein